MAKPDPIFNTDAIELWSKGVGIFDLMNSKWGWPIAEATHFLGLCMLMASVGMFDLRVLGIARGVQMSFLHRLVPIGVIGWAMCVITGFLFVVTFPTQYLHNPAFQTKIALMALAGVNMVVFYLSGASKLAKAAGPDDNAPAWVKVFAAVSLLAWLGVIAGGRWITFFRPPEFWCLWC
jgi:hypothetical protein